MIYFTDPYSGCDIIWHLGDPLPAITGKGHRSVELRADGDELAVIMHALRGGRPPVGGVIVSSPARVVAHAIEKWNGSMCPACRAMPCKCERDAATELPA